MHLLKNNKEQLLKMTLLSLGIVCISELQTANFVEANSATNNKAGRNNTQSSSTSTESDAKNFIDNISNIIIKIQKSGLSKEQQKHKLIEVAKTYADIAGLCPFIFAQYYKKLCPYTQNELITGNLIANMVAQQVLRLIPHSKHVNVIVKSATQINSKNWKVKTTYKVNKQSSVQTYDVTFSVTELEKNKFLISNITAEGVDGRIILRDGLQAKIKKKGLTETIKDLREAAS